MSPGMLMVSMPRRATMVVKSRLMRGEHYNCAPGFCKTNLPERGRDRHGSPLITGIAFALSTTPDPLFSYGMAGFMDLITSGLLAIIAVLKEVTNA